MLELQWLYVIYIIDKGVRIAHFSEFLHGFSGVWKSMSNWIRKVRLEKAAICNAKTKTTIVVQHLGVRITMVVSVGGGGRIRTIEAIRSRFTVCPLWPLGNSPIFYFVQSLSGAGRRTREIKVTTSFWTGCSICHRQIEFNSSSPCADLTLNGAGRRTRTPDLLITNQLLYQLSYTGVSNRTRLL